jgi:hypothetical protein
LLNKFEMEKHILIVDDDMLLCRSLVSLIFPQVLLVRLTMLSDKFSSPHLT